MKNIISIFIFGILLVSCTKEGPMGPMGPQGPAGPQGPINNANVISYETTLNLAILRYIAANKSYAAAADISDFYLTDQDVILIYHKYNNYWTQLPYDEWFNESYYNHFCFDYYTENNKITHLIIYIKNSSGLAPYSPMTGNLYFRIVVIKGSMTTKANIPSFINTKDYQQVKEYYNIKD